jgi:hypothetical protein
MVVVGAVVAMPVLLVTLVVETSSTTWPRLVSGRTHREQALGLVGAHRLC